MDQGGDHVGVGGGKSMNRPSMPSISALHGLNPPASGNASSADDPEASHLELLTRNLIPPSPAPSLPHHDPPSVGPSVQSGSLPGSTTTSGATPSTAASTTSASSTDGQQSDKNASQTSAIPSSVIISSSGSSMGSSAIPPPASPYSGAPGAGRFAPSTPASTGITGPASHLGPQSVAPHSVHSIQPATPTPATPMSYDPAIRPQLQNIVSTVNLGCKLDLKKIALHARNAEYNPKRFAAVIMRIRDPRTTALIFSSGKMVCTGAKSEQESRLAARKYARIVQKLGFEAKFLDFKIQNMVGSCDVKFPIRLEGLVLTHSQFSSYEPELFPGLIYRMVKPRIVLLIFVSGKVVLTGAKVREEIETAFENIYPILRGFRKQ